MSHKRISGKPRSIFKLKDLPAEFLPEIAFAGRSNVGKSSLINSLVGQRVAPISQTPGKTRSIRFYEYAFGKRRIGLIDLPGYGWAKLPESVRERWKELVEGYLIGRRVLRGVVLVVDIRRGENTLDSQMAEWLGVAGLPYIVVANKVDKIKRAQRDLLIGQIARGTQKPIQDIISYSTKSGKEKDRVLRRIQDLVVD